MITKIIIKGVVHGLNGKHGLIREHYRTAKMKKYRKGNHQIYRL
jgi:hypothetical protein